MKNLNIQIAGNLANGYRVSAGLSPITQANTSRCDRKIASTIKKELQNQKTSFLKLELLLYENFDLDDWFITFTYKPECRPSNWRDAKKRMPCFLTKVRTRRKKEQKPYSYVYVNECLHGDQRPNHHLVIKKGPESKEFLEDLWANGFIDIKTIRNFGGFQVVSKYMTKEPKEKGKPRVGERMWNPSHGLSRPITINAVVPDNFILTEPPGAVPVDKGLSIQQITPVWPLSELPRWEMITPEIETIMNQF